MSTSEDDILFDSVKAELESLVKHSYAHVAIAVAFLIYIIERQKQAVGTGDPNTLPSIGIFGLQFNHERLVFALLLIPVLQLLQLRPIQAIDDLLHRLGQNSINAKLFLATRPSVFNPYHCSESRAGRLTDVVALILAASVTCFFPSITTTIWLSEIVDGDFSLSIALFGSVLLSLAGLQLFSLYKTWRALFSDAHSLFRISIVLLSALAVGIGAYFAAI